MADVRVLAVLAMIFAPISQVTAMFNMQGLPFTLNFVSFGFSLLAMVFAYSTAYCLVTKWGGTIKPNIEVFLEMVGDVFNLIRARAQGLSSLRLKMKSFRMPHLCNTRQLDDQAELGGIFQSPNIGSKHFTLFSQPGTSLSFSHTQEATPSEKLELGTQEPARESVTQSPWSRASRSRDQGISTTFQEHNTNHALEGTGDQSRLDKAGEEDSDSEDTMSDVTDYTDTSLIEAFEASPTPFDPALLSVLLSLKEDITHRIKHKLQTTLTQATGSSNSSSKPPTSNTNSYPLSRDGSSRQKRPLRRDDDNNGDDEQSDRDDGEKKKRPNASQMSQRIGQPRKLACPFFKRYPDSSNLHTSCRARGWDTGHRVKYASSFQKRRALG